MTQPDFDQIIPRVGTHSAKWDSMQSLYGISPTDGAIPMWVADMDFRPPEAVQRAVEKLVSHGIYGYFGDESEYRNAIAWWMKKRHDWAIETDWIFTTHGLVNGTAMCVDTFSNPGDAVILMTPVYHAFARVIRASGREVRECPMIETNGRYELNLDGWQDLLTGNEKILVLCSPHNPGGRVWEPSELQSLASFCRSNNLILVSDEIHHDLVFPGHKHTVMANAAPDALDRIVVLSAGTKTFNLAGAHVGNVIIPDESLRRLFDARMKGLGMSPNAFGLHMITAAYSEDGIQWLNALMQYLDDNRRLFDEGIHKIGGLRSMPLQSTYLAWVDFSATGDSASEIARRVRDNARIAVNAGPTFGTGGDGWLRFNLATQRSRVQEAIKRLQAEFS